MRALIQNPLVRFALRMGWLPALLLVVVPFYPGLGAGFPWLVGGAIGCLGLAAGVLGVPAVQSWNVGSRERRRHASAKHRFLCPACLCFGDFRFSCGDCGKELDPLIIRTAGRYVDRCADCNAKVTPGAESGPGAVSAFCRACGASHSRSVHHERAVKVVGTLTPADFETLTGSSAQVSTDTRGFRWIRLDDGKEFEYLLSLGDLAGSRQALPPDHAARHVESVWLGEVDPLSLGQAVDSFLTLAELDDARLAAIAGCVRAEQLDPAATRLLSARFGTVKYGVAARDFFPEPSREELARADPPPGAHSVERSGPA